MSHDAWTSLQAAIFQHCGTVSPLLLISEYSSSSGHLSDLVLVSVYQQYLFDIQLIPTIFCLVICPDCPWFRPSAFLNRSQVCCVDSRRRQWRQPIWPLATCYQSRCNSWKDTVVHRQSIFHLRRQFIAEDCFQIPTLRLPNCRSPFTFYTRISILETWCMAWWPKPCFSQSMGTLRLLS